MQVSAGLKTITGWLGVIAGGLAIQSVYPAVFEVLPTLWVLVIAIGFALNGVWERRRLMIGYGLFAALGGAIVGIFLPPIFTIVAFGVFVGAGLAVVGWFTVKALIPVGLYMLLGSFFQYFGDPSRLAILPYHWFILGGAAFATIGYIGRSAITHFVGSAFMFTILGAFLTGADLAVASLVGMVVVLFGLALSWIYMYRTLGRAPRVGEILTLAARALFTYGLKRPLNHYRLVAISVQGNVATEQIADELLSKLEPSWRPIVLLGPTAPTQVRIPSSARVGWVTSLSGFEARGFSVLSPGNPSDINIFLADALKAGPPGTSPIIIGDFLDNLIPLMKEEAFFKYYSELASRIKLQNHTGVFIVKSDIHHEVAVNVVKRFADVIIENREREERNRLVREVRVSNKVDNLHTDWQKVPVAAA